MTTQSQIITCCFYAYFEKDELYKKNFEYFLRYGLHPDIDYFFIINGECSLDIPFQSNITVVRRKNEGYDFGAFAHMSHLLSCEYRYYFFMNASVRGPFLRDRSLPWPSLFTALLDQETKLAGTTINIYVNNPSFAHVQSMFFVMDNELFHYLRDEKDFFNENRIIKMNFRDIIFKKEMGLSRIVLQRGWNINCIIDGYRGIDYRTMKVNHNPWSRDGDVYYPGALFGRNIDPYEVVFFKTTRLPFPETDDA